MAARGIDVPQVSHVINFDVPLVYDDYVHRIGRTGRAQHTGAAITFANEAEMHHMQRIEELIRQPIPLLPLPPEVEVAKTSFEEQQSMDREKDERRKREDPSFQGAFHERKEWIKPGVTIDKRTGREYVAGPNRSQKGQKANPSKGKASSPSAKAFRAAQGRARNRRSK